MTEVATGESTLNWDVLVTPGIPTIASDRAPRTKQLMWPPISSTFISGKRDAVLVDTFITVEQADILVNWVAASGKNLTTIYVTHGRARGDSTTRWSSIRIGSIRGERSGSRRARSNLKLFRTKGVFLCGSCNS